MSSFGIRSLACERTRSRREDLLTLSQKERDRLVYLRLVHEGHLPVSEGARRAGAGRRHFRRMLRRFEAGGDAVVVHAASTEATQAGAAVGGGIMAIMGTGVSVFMAVACLIGFAIACFLGREMKPEAAPAVN